MMNVQMAWLFGTLQRSRFRVEKRLAIAAEASVVAMDTQ